MSHTHGALDATSKAIVKRLQHNGRMSYSALAKDVGLSETAVRLRVGRLIESGLMRIVGVADPLALGLAHQAMVGLHVGGPLEPVVKSIADLDEVDVVVIAAGPFDILAEVATRTYAQLETVIGQLRRTDGVIACETFMYLKVIKQTQWRAQVEPPE